MRRLTIVGVLFLSLACGAWASAMVARPTGAGSTSSAQLSRETSSLAQRSKSDSVGFLLGERAVEPNAGRSRGRAASAFAFKAASTGTAKRIDLYVDRGSSARKIVVGLYASKAGRPARLLASGSLTRAASGRWDSVHIGSTSVTVGQTYWLVVLGQGGTAHFRDDSHGSCLSESSAQAELRSLPRSWTNGARERACPISEYVVGIVAPSASKASVPTGSAGTTAGGADQTSTPAAQAATVPTVTVPPTPTVPDLLTPSATADPAITGTAQQGQTLSTSTGTWTNEPTSYSYQWQDCSGSGANCSTIRGATSSTYTLTTTDVGSTIRSVVTASNLLGSGSASSAETAVVTPLAPVSSGAPTISGTAQQGDALAVSSNGVWSGNPTGYSYQWQDCNTQGASCASVAGATSTSYTLGAGDVGDTVRVEVSACNAGGCSTPASSMASGVVAASGGSGGGGASAPANTVEPYFTPSTVNSSGSCSAGCAIEGQQLSVTPGAWANGPTSYSYQWQDCTTNPGTSTGAQDGSDYAMTLPTTTSCANATGPGSTSSTYTVSSGDVGKALAVKVTASNGSGSTSTAVSGSCDTGLMTTQMPDSSNPPGSGQPSSTYFDNGEPGCSPISAVVGTSQYGAGTSGEHFCTNAPVTCGFADIANTGPAPGTTLYAVPGTCTSPSGPGAGCANTGSGWSYSDGSIHLTSGSTLKDVIYDNGIGVSGLSNVTIEDSEIKTSGPNSIGVALSDASNNITITNNDIFGASAAAPGDGCFEAVQDLNGNTTNVTLTNNNVWYCAEDFNMFVNGGWTIANNYLHDFSFSESAASDHFDGIQFENGGNGEATPTYNNTILMDWVQTSPMILSNDESPENGETNRQIVHNLLAGGSFTLYVAGHSQYPTTDSTFSNNVFSSIYLGATSSGSTDASGSQGPVDNWAASTNTWSTDLWDDSGAAVSP